MDSSYLAYACEFSLYSGPCTMEHRAVMTSALSKPMAGKRCRPRLVVSLSSHLDRFRSLRKIDMKALSGFISTWLYNPDISKITTHAIHHPIYSASFTMVSDTRILSIVTLPGISGDELSGLSILSNTTLMTFSPRAEIIAEQSRNNTWTPEIYLKKPVHTRASNTVARENEPRVEHLQWQWRSKPSERQWRTM